MVALMLKFRVPLYEAPPRERIRGTFVVTDPRVNGLNRLGLSQHVKGSFGRA